MKKILQAVFWAIAAENNEMDRGPDFYRVTLPRAVGMTRELFDQVEAEAMTTDTIVNPMHATSEKNPEIMGLPVLIVPGCGRKLWMMRELPLFLEETEGDE